MSEIEEFDAAKAEIEQQLATLEMNYHQSESDLKERAEVEIGALTLHWTYRNIQVLGVWVPWSQLVEPEKELRRQIWRELRKYREEVMYALGIHDHEY